MFKLSDTLAHHLDALKNGHVIPLIGIPPSERDRIEPELHDILKQFRKDVDRARRIAGSRAKSKDHHRQLMMQSLTDLYTRHINQARRIESKRP